MHFFPINRSNEIFKQVNDWENFPLVYFNLWLLIITLYQHFFQKDSAQNHEIIHVEFCGGRFLC